MARLNILSKEEELQNELIALRKQLKQTERCLKEERLKNMTNELIINLAEQMNNMVKNGWLFDTEQLDYGQLSQAVDKAIQAYNSLRLYQSLAMCMSYEQMLSSLH